MDIINLFCVVPQNLTVCPAFGLVTLCAVANLFSKAFYW